MSSEKLEIICDRVIEYSFYLLFFLVPLIITPWNFELFEYNKMMLTYSLTIVIVGSWLIKMTLKRRFIFRRTPFDAPLLFFLLSQLLSTIFSIDRHTSIWGYYSRFHGGLLSTVSYILLYYALVSNFDKQKVLSSIRYTLASAFLVASYGIAEHLGIDAQYWVQDVKNRVFSTLGQPNWLAAWLSALIPIAIALGIKKTQIRMFWKYGFLLLAALFYLTFLYTKSRSGFLGFWTGNFIFWAIFFFQFRKQFLRWFLIVNCTFLIINFLVGSPFEQINRYTTLDGLQGKTTKISPPTPGGTESGEIRKIVWQGAMEIWRHYPLFGSGVETFAYSYYQFRPVEHNLVSEWDFLYNKAHNEYLNYLATTGTFGLGSYLLVIGWFIVWFIRKFTIYNLQFTIKKNKNSTLYIINYALLAGYISILVSNFFGFSVVPLAILFFLYPGFAFVLTQEQQTMGKKRQSKFTNWQYAGFALILFTISYSLFTLSRLWLADVAFAQGERLNKQTEYSQAFNSLKKAIQLNSGEPNYQDELAWTAANLAVLAFDQKETTTSAQLLELAISSSDQALAISPRHLNFWKTRARLYYKISQIDSIYLQKAQESLLKASQLAPTEAKIAYNLGLVYLQLGQTREAQQTLEKTVAMKQNYQEARYALALLYWEEDEKQKAIEQLEYILKFINPEDSEVKQKLKEIQI